MTRADEIRFLSRALVLARRGCGHTRPNPPVGAVLVADGKIIGEGWHRRAGGDHAEVAAIKSAMRKRRGRPFGGSPVTLFVTLEPCSRPGRVGACTDAIKAAGISRVVYAVQDPNPANRGRAARILSRAGIACSRFTGDAALLAEARHLIAPFARHVTTGLPFVTVKLALSLDGRICDTAGRSNWISSARARRLTGALRAEVDAIMVGAETVRKDDPSLLCHERRNDDLVRVVVSGSGRLPRKAQVLTDGKNPTLVYSRANGRSKDFLLSVLADLARRGVMHVLCEGGLRLATSLAEAGLVNEWITVLAPCVIGGRPIAEAKRLKLERHFVADPSSGDIWVGCRLDSHAES